MSAALTKNYSYRHALALPIAITTFVPAAYSLEFENSQTPRIEAFASFAPKAKTGSDKAKTVLTAQEMIAGLRANGLPISAIAEAMRVERKSIYSWLNGGDMRSANIQRAGQLHTLFNSVASVDARDLYRFWNTPTDGKATLRELMIAETIDEAATAGALNKLRPAALRAMENERKMAQQGTSNPSLDDIPEAGANR
jgi:hypothetical protein